jgi:hypothetical protein
MLGACSKAASSNGGAAAPSSPSSSNWDSLTWDQGSWS